MTKTGNAAGKFNAGRAAEYAVQSRIALAGYDACHELAACLLAADLGPGRPARILVAGAGGTAREIVSAARLERLWHFTAVDPSAPMLELAMAAVGEAGLTARTTPVLGEVAALPEEPIYDAATLIGVLHHLPGEAAKQSVLDALAKRLKPKAPLILAGNRHAYESRPLFLSAWGERWRMHGATAAEIEAKLGKIRQGADPPASDQEVAGLLTQAGFEEPTLFFSSLFWGGWITHRRG
ncbi:class I SAM-dependent methyltransferase [Labrys sp. LIt4]|uniref:class I SAM-dependent methyltransferase n=1 Tax=Labrys sp. LIt4 TaxID=2821355 RepID=UPI001AE05491|nr:class I SAM-dependent methyltransferase [Labrys sp. LIt4]MBP0581055.1 class I SAM-dependent methyltransferase [Labrys sp. LIt4]